MSKKRPKPISKDRLQAGVKSYQGASRKKHGRPKDTEEDTGDDIEELVVLRLDTITTLTARSDDGVLRKVFVGNSKAYMRGTRHEFRVAKNGAYHEIAAPAPVKKIMTFEEYEKGT